MFVQLGFDSYKLDGCSAEKNISRWYELTHSLGTGATLENCHNGPWVPWGSSYADEAGCPFHSYRSSPDIRANYPDAMCNLQTVFPLVRANMSGPGCWAYPDMLEVGNMQNFTEARSHFGAWCIVSSPLTLGFDVRDDARMDAAWPIISNTEAIAVNQAWAGSPGNEFASSNETITFPGLCHMPAWQMLYKPQPGGATALLLLNHGNFTIPVAVEWDQVPGLTPGGSYQVRDIWAGKDLGPMTSYNANVASHDSVFLMLKGA